MKNKPIEKYQLSNVSVCLFSNKSPKTGREFGICRIEKFYGSIGNYHSSYIDCNLAELSKLALLTDKMREFFLANTHLFSAMSDKRKTRVPLAERQVAA